MFLERVLMDIRFLVKAPFPGGLYLKSNTYFYAGSLFTRLRN